MTLEELKGRVETGLQSGSPLLELRESLVAFAQDGGSQAEGREVLCLLREAATSEPEEDRILELLDFVEGFTRPELRIW